MKGSVKTLFPLVLALACLAACGGESPPPEPSPLPDPAPLPTSSSPSPSPSPAPAPIPEPSPLPPETELPATTPEPGPEPAVAPPLPTAPPLPEPEPVAWAADGVISPDEYPIAVEYRDWQVSWRTDAAYAYFAIRARTKGYVALGIQPGRTMKDADMIFGYVKDGAVTVLDMFSIGSFGPHPEDTAQGGTDDILEAGGSEAEGFTTIELKRALSTGDAYDLPLNPGTNKIIWAYGPADSPTGGHSSRGYGEIVVE